MLVIMYYFNIIQALLSKKVGDRVKNTSKSICGIARDLKLTSEQKIEIAKKGAEKRWDQSIPCASHQGYLSITDKNIKCVVTDTGDRILSLTNVFETFGRKIRGRKIVGRDVIRPPFIDALNLQAYISDELEELMIPIEYRDLSGKIAKGYKADILAQICLAYIKADSDKKLLPAQKRMLDTSVLILGALSTVGIIALVDEATGYQKDRAKDALSKILEAFISRELQPWISTVPASFYEELFRLRELNYLSPKIKRPWHFGCLTNNIVYSRLAPGILDELKRVSEKDSKGRLKHRLFQKLTNNTGYMKLKEHLASVVSIMKLSSNYAEFIEHLDKIHPKCSVEFDVVEIEQDTGVGF